MNFNNIVTSSLIFLLVLATAAFGWRKGVKDEQKDVSVFFASEQNLLEVGVGLGTFVEHLNKLRNAREVLRFFSLNTS